MSSTKTEYFLKFQCPQYGSGIHEKPSENTKDAAMALSEDHDIVSVLEITSDMSGAIVDMRDATKDVLVGLTHLIEEGIFEDFPHPLVAQEFNAWLQAARAEDEIERDHQRIESAMLHI